MLLNTDFPKLRLLCVPLLTLSLLGCEARTENDNTGSESAQNENMSWAAVPAGLCFWRWRRISC